MPARSMRKPSGLVACCLLLVAVGAGCRNAGDRSVPPELVGIWTTSAPRYAGHYLRITPTVVGFGADEAGYTYYDIERIERSSEPGQMGYIIVYQNHAGQEYTLAFYYTPQDGGTIRLKNQGQWIWIKEG
jgi:hypothetical protein